MNAAKPAGTLTPVEAAHLLGSTDSTIRKWATVGCYVAGRTVMLSCEMIGTRYYIPVLAIEQFKQDCAAARRGEAEDADARLRAIDSRAIRNRRDDEELAAALEALDRMGSNRNRSN